MSDKTVFGCAETGTYQTSAPNPHIELSGTASSLYTIAQVFADAMSTDETATISIIKDKDNWAVYGGAKFTNSTIDTLDLTVATLLESKGTLSDEDAVTCLGLAPGARGVTACRVYRGSSLSSPNNTTAKLALDTVIYDTGGMWDSNNTRFIPKQPGYYLVEGRLEISSSTNMSLMLYKNNSNINYLGASGTAVFTSHGLAIVYCNGSTDYLELFVRTSTSSALYITSDSTYAVVIGPLAQ